MPRRKAPWAKEWLFEGVHYCYLLNPRVCSSFFRGLMDGPVWETRKAVFTFIRHPWDRLVSSLSLLGGHPDLWRRYQRNENDLHLHPQTWFLAKWPVDFIGKYENLEGDYRRMQETFGHSLPPLRVVHASKGRRSWQETDFPWDRVYDRYAGDFEVGGYSR